MSSADELNDAAITLTTMSVCAAPNPKALTCCHATSAAVAKSTFVADANARVAS